LGKSVLPIESRFLDAIKSGLPPSSGVALGFDRVLLVATGEQNISRVMPFPDEIA
jgi:elongation factor P--beta-lysine ligase